MFPLSNLAMYNGVLFMGKSLLLLVIVAASVCGGPSVRGDSQPSQQRTQNAETAAALVEALKDKDASVRLQAAQLLTQMGQGKAAVPTLVELLKAPQTPVRFEAAQLLKQLGPSRPKAALPALIALLKDGDANIRPHGEGHYPSRTRRCAEG
jgi:HEAT repeat protein